LSTLNLQVNSIAYSDVTPSNNPALRNWDLVIKNMGEEISNPKSQYLVIPPGVAEVIFSGVRTTAIDGTSAFTVTRPDPTTNTYRFAWAAGTLPVFRTARNIAINNTSTFTVSVNGPIATYTNTGGTLMNTATIQIGDIVKITANSGFSQSNRGRFKIVAKTSNSISIQNLDAAGESTTIVDPTQFLVYSNGGASNQIQIGDKVVISAGFSSATFDTYVISEVTPNYFEVLIAAPNGIPLESNIIPGASGMVFYSAAKKFILIAAQQKCSVRVNGDTSDLSLVEPVAVGDPESPGLYIKQGTVYSLSINNLSLDPLSVIVASAE